MPMGVEALLERYRSSPGCLGMAIFEGGALAYAEGLESVRAAGMLQLLEISGARRASAALGSVTLVAFKADDLAVVLLLAGRFPAFSDDGPARAPELPSREEARRAAEAALRGIGLLP